MADLDPRQVLRGGYDRIAARYAHWVADGPVDTAAVLYLQNLVEHLRPGAQALDLGCGGGDRWPHLVDQFTLTGVDISFQQLRRAREVLPHARLIQADMTRLELPPAAFDARLFRCTPSITCRSASSPDVLTSIARWPRPGGLLLANMGTRHNRGTFEAGWLGSACTSVAIRWTGVRHSCAQQDSRSNQPTRKRYGKRPTVARRPRVFCGLLPSDRLRDALT